MEAKSNTNKKNIFISFKSVIIAVTGFIGFSGLTGIVRSVKQSYFEKPALSCQIKSDGIQFQVAQDFRNVTLNLHPQLVVLYGNKDIFLFIDLIDRYEPEFMQLDQAGRCETKQLHQHYLDEVKDYIKRKVYSRLEQISTTEEAEEICSRLTIEESLMGGLQYMSLADGANIKKSCIIEKDGMVRDVPLDDKEIDERLWETEITLYEDLKEANLATLDEIAQSLADGLLDFYQEKGKDSA